MQIFENLIKCCDCGMNTNNKCMLYPGKDVNEKDSGCYCGIDMKNKQKLADDYNIYF